MAETYSPRFGIIVWGAPTDGPSRVEFNAAFNQVETLAAIDVQGTFAARPAPGTQGRYYYATDNGVLYRDTGAAWTVVGASGIDAVVNASTSAAVPLTVAGVSGQTAHLLDAKVLSTTMAYIGADGSFNGSNFVGSRGQFTASGPTVVPLYASGMASQTADIVQVVDSAAANLFKVSATGVVSGKYIGAGDGAAYVGAASATPAGSMTLFSGTPALEVYMDKGGSGSTFQDFLYLHHLAAGAAAVSRRLGVLMQFGDGSGNQTKSGALYIESSNASAATPSLVLAKGDTPVMTFPGSGDPRIISLNLQVDGAIRSQRTSGGPSYQFGDSVGGMGMQGSNEYLRASTAGGLYFYSGGVHSDTPGAPGSGGTTLASLTRSGSDGLFTANRANFTNSTSLPSSIPALAVGPLGSTNLQFSGTTIQAANNSAVWTLSLNTNGGNVALGSAAGTVAVGGAMTVGGDYVTASSDGINTEMPTSGTTNSGSYTNVPGNLAVTLHKRFSATRIKIDMSAGNYANASGTKVRFGVNIGGDLYNVAQSFHGSANDPKDAVGFRYFSGYPAGDYNIPLLWLKAGGSGTAYMDPNCWVSFGATECN